MTESSDDSVDTVISALDSRLLHSPSADSLTPQDSSLTSASPEPDKLTDMGNRFGGDKKKKDEKPQEKKPEERKPKEKKPDDKPKKKGKKSKGKSKRHSYPEGDAIPGELHGACASPSKAKAKSRRPDVLADLGAHSSGSPLGSPVSGTGSQGTYSHDDESDVSTLGYSTPLLSTPQVQRYVMPHQQNPKQTSTERLEELGRSIEKTIIDKLSEKSPPEEGAAASPVSTTEKKQKRHVKKKRVLGQAVIDSDAFTLPLEDTKSEQSKTSHNLNVGTISLRASRESPVSPWLRDDDTPIDEEQMDEMFISCIDLSYNLSDICSEREFTEYGSLDSKRQSKPANARPKEASLSPSIARRATENTPTQARRAQPKFKAADSRDTPPKSDSSTSTLAEVGLDSLVDSHSMDKHHLPMTSGESKQKPAENNNLSLETQQQESVSLANYSPSLRRHTEFSRINEPEKIDKTKSEKQAIEDKSPDKSKIENEANQSDDIPTRATPEKDDIPCEKAPVVDITRQTQVEYQTSDKSEKDNDTNVSISEQNIAQDDEDEQISVNTQSCNTEQPDVISSSCAGGNIQTLPGNTNSVSTVSDEHLESKSFVMPETDTVLASDVATEGSSHKTSESLSPPESVSPKHVPPPSPSAMDALAEVDEEDEEAVEAAETGSQSKEVQLFGETVLKRLSSLVESQSQDEELEDRFQDFGNSDDENDSRPVCLGPMLLDEDMTQYPGDKTPVHETEEAQSTDILEERIVSKHVASVETSRPFECQEDMSVTPKAADSSPKDDKDADCIDEGTLKRKKKKRPKKEKVNKDPRATVVKKPEIPAELKQAENTKDSRGSKTKTEEKHERKKKTEESEKENTPPKRESQQITEVIDAYGVGDDLTVDMLPKKCDVGKSESCGERPLRETDGDSDGSLDSRSRSSGQPSRSSLELSRDIPEIEETFSELLSVKHILDDLEDRTPTGERFPSFISSDGIRSPPEHFNGRRSRMSPAITDRTESDLDISEQRDDISTDSMYADDEDDGASEVLFSRSYSEPDGTEAVVSCTFYNTTHCTNAEDSDDFWEDYTTADESFKQIEISADAASSTFQNARKQMHDIHQHLQDLRRQMEQLQDEVENATLTSEYSVDSDKRMITE